MKTLKLKINEKTLNANALNCLKELEEKGFIRDGMIVYEEEQETEVKRILEKLSNY